MGVDVTASQQVEGFAETVSASSREFVAGTARHRRPGPDFRGQATAAMTREWWVVTDGSPADVVWRTAPVPRAVDTTFTFSGASANLPENVVPPHQATLYLGGERLLSFDLGQRSPSRWTESDVTLTFSPRQVHSTVEGYHRQLAAGGVSGLYHLSVPGRLLSAGEPAELRVVVEEPVRAQSSAWFAVYRRPDTLEQSARTNEEQIVQLQQEVIHLKRIVGNLARRSYPELFPERLPTEDVLIYTNGRAHVHPPDVLLLHNRDLLVGFREATEHLSLDGAIVLVRSRDGGQTWGERQVVREHSRTDWRDVSIAQLRDGTLLINPWPNDFYDAQGRYMDRPEPTYPGYTAGIYVGRSTDNGHTWTWPDPPLDPAPFGGIYTSERIVELPAGRLLMATYFWHTKDLRHYGCAIHASDDGGHTWRYLTTVADVPGVELDEPALIRARSGRLLCLMRNETGPYYYQTVSDDDGATWTPAAPTAIPGHRNPASLVVLPDGTVLCVSGVRGDPSGIYVVASYDEGATWDMAQRRVIRDDFPNFDCTYTSTVVMPDGRVLVVYYFNMFDRFFIAGSFFRWPH
jgi:hypothetical protein